MLGRQNRRRRRDEKTVHLMLQLARISRLKAEMEFFSQNWAIHYPYYVYQNQNPCMTPSKSLFSGIMNEGILNTGILNLGVLIPPWYDVIWWGLNEGWGLTWWLSGHGSNVKVMSGDRDGSKHQKAAWIAAWLWYRPFSSIWMLTIAFFGLSTCT